VRRSNQSTVNSSCVMGTWIKVAAVVVVAVLAASVFVAWRDARKEQAALQAELKTTQQALAEATARQASRDAAVNDLVAGLKKKEAAVQKPAQVVAALQDVLTLPAPITIETERPASPPSSGQAEGGPYNGRNPDNVPNGIQPKINFPAADLKPLFARAAKWFAIGAAAGAIAAKAVR